VRLTPTEFRLLSALLARPGACLRRRELASLGWPDGAIVHANTLDAYMARLRRKLRRLDAETQIVTLRGVGYALRQPVN
jgi:two-component system response regulator MprA